jgi:hypothetical protein
MAYHTIGLGRSITHGIINALYSNVIQFSAPISSGNSCAPRLDVYGEVVGIVTSAAMPKKAPRPLFRTYITQYQLHPSLCSCVPVPEEQLMFNWQNFD